MNDTQHAGATSQFKIHVEEKTHVGADGSELMAISDFDLELKPESMTVLMGPSGCGKTTLLRIIAQLDDRFIGKVEYPADVRIGFMFQEPRLLPWRTVRENIELVAAPDFGADDLDRLADETALRTLGVNAEVLAHGGRDRRALWRPVSPG